jgi:polyketide cyclase/dehydrase/lipid transport protein
MKSVIALEIKAPQARVAELFANPENSPQWMDDLARYEAMSGKPGMPGSKYRLVPKKGAMVFVATVIARDLPGRAEVHLDSPTVAVSVTGTFEAVSPDRTRLVSEEVFTFKGLVNRAFGFFAQPAIRRAHRRHMEAFKRFAEGAVR